MRELVKSEHLLHPSFILLLPLVDPGGGDGGHAHPVPQEQDHVLRTVLVLVQLETLPEVFLAVTLPELRSC